MPQSIPRYGLEAGGGALNGYPYNRMQLRQRFMADHLSLIWLLTHRLRLLSITFLFFISVD